MSDVSANLKAYGAFVANTPAVKSAEHRPTSGPERAPGMVLPPLSYRRARIRNSEAEGRRPPLVLPPLSYAQEAKSSQGAPQNTRPHKVRASAHALPSFAGHGDKKTLSVTKSKGRRSRLPTSPLRNETNAFAIRANQGFKNVKPYRAPDLTHVADGHAMLKAGAQGSSVYEVQNRLRLHGISAGFDGDFGRGTYEAVLAFQQRFAPKMSDASGIVDAATLRALFKTPHDGDIGRSWASSAGRASAAIQGERFAPAPLRGRANQPFSEHHRANAQQAERLLRANGVGRFEEGKVYVVQIDQDSPKASDGPHAIGDYLRSYSGKIGIFLVRRAQDGSLGLEQQGPVLRSASHPARKKLTKKNHDKWYAPGGDVDGDGTFDVSHLNPGRVVYKGSSYVRRGKDGNPRPGSPRAFRARSKTYVTRDVDHNGVIDRRDLTAGGKPTARGLVFHAGGNMVPSSIGCQTLPPKEFTRFQETLDALVRQNGQRSWEYLLVFRDHELYGRGPQRR